MTVLRLSGCLDFEGLSAAMLTYMIYSPKGLTTKENKPKAGKSHQLATLMMRLWVHLNKSLIGHMLNTVTEIKDKKTLANILRR